MVLPPNFKCLRLQIWPQNSLRVPGDLICQGKQFSEIFSGDQSLQNIPWNELFGKEAARIRSREWSERKPGVDDIWSSCTTSISRYRYQYLSNLLELKFHLWTWPSDWLSSIDTGATSAAKKSIDFYRYLSCQKIFLPLLCSFASVAKKSIDCYRYFSCQKISHPLLCSGASVAKNQLTFVDIWYKENCPPTLIFWCCWCWWHCWCSFWPENSPTVTAKFSPKVESHHQILDSFFLHPHLLFVLF